jgi:pimeloyl-ACP methyl ester carboxylesterase
VIKIAFIPLCVAVLVGCGQVPTPSADALHGRDGDSQRIEVAGGFLKAEAYASRDMRDRPVLVAVLHGDLFDPTPSYQYAFAQLLVQGASAPSLPDSVRSRLAEWEPLQNTVAIGILRPGYTDNAGDRSTGERGEAVGDNYTPEVVDAVAEAVRGAQRRYAASAVVLVGHSGGAAIVADVLGRQPDLAAAGVLVACGCDPRAWRSRMADSGFNPMWRGETRSVQPLEQAEHVRTETIVRLVVGQDDDVALPEYSRHYAEVLMHRGIDAKVTVLPGLGHNIMFQQAVLAEVKSIVEALGNRQDARLIADERAM